MIIRLVRSPGVWGALVTEVSTRGQISSYVDSKKALNRSVLGTFCLVQGNVLYTIA